LPCVSIGIEPRALLQQWFWPGAAPIFERFVAESGIRLAHLRDAFQALRKPSSGRARIVLALGWATGIRLHSFFPRLTRRRWHA